MPVQRTPPQHNTRGNHDNHFVRFDPYAAGETVETVNGNGNNSDTSNVQANTSDRVEEGVVNESTRTPNGDRLKRLQESMLDLQESVRQLEEQRQQPQDDQGGGDGVLHTPGEPVGSPGAGGSAELNDSVRRSTPNSRRPELGHRVDEDDDINRYFQYHQANDNEQHGQPEETSGAEGTVSNDLSLKKLAKDIIERSNHFWDFPLLEYVLIPNYALPNLPPRTEDAKRTVENCYEPLIQDFYHMEVNQWPLHAKQLLEKILDLATCIKEELQRTQTFRPAVLHWLYVYTVQTTMIEIIASCYHYRAYKNHPSMTTAMMERADFYRTIAPIMDNGRDVLTHIKMQIPIPGIHVRPHMTIPLMIPHPFIKSTGTPITNSLMVDIQGFDPVVVAQGYDLWTDSLRTRSQRLRDALSRRRKAYTISTALDKIKFEIQEDRTRLTELILWRSNELSVMEIPRDIRFEQDPGIPESLRQFLRIESYADPRGRQTERGSESTATRQPRMETPRSIPLRRPLHVEGRFNSPSERRQEQTTSSSRTHHQSVPQGERHGDHSTTQMNSSSFGDALIDKQDADYMSRKISSLGLKGITEQQLAVTRPTMPAISLRERLPHQQKYYMGYAEQTQTIDPQRITDPTQKLHAMMLMSQSTQQALKTIPYFSGGRPDEFYSFFEIFTALVDQDATLPDTVKLMTLRKHLNRGPFELINHLEVVGRNYSEAKTILVAEYGNIPVFVKQLKHNYKMVSPLTKDNANSFDKFSKFKQATEKLINNITKFAPEELSNTDIIESIEARLDPSRFKTWRKVQSQFWQACKPDEHAYNNGVLHQLMAMLNDEYLVLQDAKIYNIGYKTKQPSFQPKTPQKKNPKPWLKNQNFRRDLANFFTGVNGQKPKTKIQKQRKTTSFTTQGNPRPTSFKQNTQMKPNSAQQKKGEGTCLFCKPGKHASVECTYTKPAQKFTILFQQERCRVCFRKGHVAKDCSSKHTCLHCKQTNLHHTSVHMDRDAYFDISKKVKDAKKNGAPFQKQK